MLGGNLISFNIQTPGFGLNIQTPGLRFSDFPTHCKPSRWCETIVYKHSGLDILAVTLWQSLCCFDYYSNLFIPLISFFTWWSTCLVSQRTSFAMFLSPNVKYLFSFEVHFVSYWLCFENLRFYLLYSAMCSSFTDVVQSGSCLLLILAHTSKPERCLLGWYPSTLKCYCSYATKPCLRFIMCYLVLFAIVEFGSLLFWKQVLLLY